MFKLTSILNPSCDNQAYQNHSISWNQGYDAGYTDGERAGYFKGLEAGRIFNKLKEKE